jgi:hypothetical protein
MRPYSLPCRAIGALYGAVKVAFSRFYAAARRSLLSVTESDYSLGALTPLEQGVSTLSERDREYHREVAVRCLACEMPYAVTQTVRDFYSSEGTSSGGTKNR